jgi:hypothetical protein
MTKDGTDIKPRQVYFRRIYHPLTRQVLDRGIVLLFEGKVTKPFDETQF